MKITTPTKTPKFKEVDDLSVALKRLGKPPNTQSDPAARLLKRIESIRLAIDSDTTFAGYASPIYQQFWFQSSLTFPLQAMPKVLVILPPPPTLADPREPLAMADFPNGLPPWIDEWLRLMNLVLGPVEQSGVPWLSIPALFEPIAQKKQKGVAVAVSKSLLNLKCFERVVCVGPAAFQVHTMQKTAPSMAGLSGSVVHVEAFGHLPTLVVPDFSKLYPVVDTSRGRLSADQYSLHLIQTKIRAHFAKLAQMVTNFCQYEN